MIMPHPLNRPYQQETYDKIINSDAKFIIVQLKPGIGKTAEAAQAACDGYKTMACTANKSLQVQYEKYGFENITGKSNYPCNSYGQNLKTIFDFSDNEIEVTADLCECPDEYKEQCIASCAYPRARWEFVTAQAGVTNYKKFLTDRTIVNSNDYVRGFDPDILFLDEAHELSNLVIEYSGLSYSWNNKYVKMYTKPVYIDIEEIMKREDIPFPMALPIMMNKSIEWLNEFYYSLIGDKPLHPQKGGNLSLWKWHKRQVDKLEIVIDLIKENELSWFIYSDNDGITIKPMTAKYNFKKFFDKSPKIVMMSGTIQKKSIESLGLMPEEFEYFNMPNPFKPQDRPVYDLRGPKITKDTTYAEARQHAQIIANIFQNSPDHWNGIVHMPSKKKSEDWGDMLHQMTKRPVYVPEKGLPTDEAYQRWIDFESNNTGAIAVAWNMMTGIDGRNININITGCIPYPNFGDRFQRAKFDYSPGQALREVASLTEQQQYRNRRGFEDHYGPKAEKFNGICDGKLGRIRSMLDKDFSASIVKYN